MQMTQKWQECQIDCFKENKSY